MGILGRKALVEIQNTGNRRYKLDKTLFVPILGQSNARNMTTIFESYGSSLNDNSSGGLVLEAELSSSLDREVVVSDNSVTELAIGGTRLYSDRYKVNDDGEWWHPEGLLPASTLRKVKQELDVWLNDNGASSTDEIAIVWSQGEADALRNRSFQSPLDREQYKQSLNSVFDYLRDNLDYDLDFYIVPIGDFTEEGAINRGFSTEEIDLTNQGREIISEIQAEVALERDDVRLTSHYSDLNSVYEEGLLYGENYDLPDAEWSTDIWHLGHDGLKVNGDRLAQYIAVDRGKSHVISYSDSFGNPADSVAISRDALLDIKISPMTWLDPIAGTEMPDVVVGTMASDRIIAGEGDDVIIGSMGVDTLVGGAGNDVFFFDSLIRRHVFLHHDRILDFELNRDRLDVSELLVQVNYTGDDPIRDEYLSIEPISTDIIKIKFDADGAGSQNPQTLATLSNVNYSDFRENFAEQLIVKPTEFS